MKSKKFLPLLLCLVLALSALSPTALAEDMDTPVDEPVEPEPYQYIYTTYGYVSISGGTATCYCYASCGSSYICSISMYLQRSTNASSWASIASWSTSGTGGASMTRYKSVSSGYYYRLYYVVRVKNSSGTTLETTYGATSAKYY